MGRQTGAGHPGGAPFLDEDFLKKAEDFLVTTAHGIGGSALSGLTSTAIGKAAQASHYYSPNITSGTTTNATYTLASSLSTPE